MVFCTCVTWPVPLQVVHFTGDVPGFAPVPWQVAHSSSLVIIISFSTPENACSNVISICTFKSEPFLGPLCLLDEPLPPNPPPKKD